MQVYGTTLLSRPTRKDRKGQEAAPGQRKWYCNRRSNRCKWNWLTYRFALATLKGSIGNNFNQEESENAKQIRRAVMQMARRKEEERNRQAEQLTNLKMEKQLS